MAPQLRALAMLPEDPRDSSQRSIIPVPGEPMSSLASVGTKYTYDLRTHMLIKYLCISNKNEETLRKGGDNKTMEV